MRGTEAALPGGHCSFGCSSPHSTPGFCRDKGSLPLPSAAWVSQQPGHPQKGAAAKDKEGQELPILFSVFLQSEVPCGFQSHYAWGFAQSHIPHGEGLGLALQLVAQERGLRESPRDCLWALAFHGEEQDNIHMRQLGHPPVHP